MWLLKMVSKRLELMSLLYYVTGAYKFSKMSLGLYVYDYNMHVY